MIKSYILIDPYKNVVYLSKRLDEAKQYWEKNFPCHGFYIQALKGHSHGEGFHLYKLFRHPTKKGYQRKAWW